MPGGGFDRKILDALLSVYSAAVIVVSEEYEILECRGDLAGLLGAACPDACALFLRSPSAGIGAAVRRVVELSHRTGAGHSEVVAVADRDDKVESRALRVTAFCAGGFAAGPAFAIVFEPSHSASDAATELAASRQLLERVIEDYETNTGELRAAHEELQTANDELLRTNQELEDSRSTLEVLNRDLRETNRKLAQANQDLANVLDGVPFPVLVLDGDLRVRRFNHLAREVFGVLPSDLGRPISDLRPRLSTPDLARCGRKVVEELTPCEQEVCDGEGGPSMLSIRPYRAAGNVVGGVVVTVTPLWKVENLSQER